MMEKIKLYSFQEVLNLYPAYAPSSPHSSDISASWFTDMLASAGLEFNVITLGNEYSNAMINEIVNAVMTIVYNRWHKFFLFEQRTCRVFEEFEPMTHDDFKEAINPILNVLDLTVCKYIPLLKETEKVSNNPVNKLETENFSKMKFNDTPQNEGLYEDALHATNVSLSSNKQRYDVGTAMQRLSELYKDFKSIILDWSNEFERVFIIPESIF